MKVETPQPHYSIIIPAFNEEEELPETLDALRKAQAGLRWTGELVVTDNNSTDKTAAVAETAGARVVFESINQISRARNAGANIARGNWLVFVDADTRISAELLHTALLSLDSGSVAGGGALVSFDQPIRGFARLALNSWNFLSRTAKLAAGSFLFVRRDVFFAVGGFSEEVYAGEEVILSRAVRRYGKRHGLSFQIIKDPPVSTSARKLRWYSPHRIFFMVLFHALLPFSVRSRRACGFWYRRPKPSESSPTDGADR